MLRFKTDKEKKKSRKMGQLTSQLPAK